MFEKLLDALLNLFDDVRDARELRILQLRDDTRKAMGLTLLEIGQACIETGHELTRRPLMGPRLPREKLTLVKICGAIYNTSDGGWIYCDVKLDEECCHQGDHFNSNTGKHWPQAAPQEQPGVISAEYDD